MIRNVCSRKAIPPALLTAKRSGKQVGEEPLVDALVHTQENGLSQLRAVHLGFVRGWLSASLFLYPLPCHFRYSGLLSVLIYVYQSLPGPACFHYPFFFPFPPSPVLSFPSSLSPVSSPFPYFPLLPPFPFPVILT